MLGLDIAPIAPTIFFSFYYAREIWRLYKVEKQVSIRASLLKTWLRYALSPCVIRNSVFSSVRSSGMMMGVEIV
ncbi:MAG: hypothetical protein DRR42_03540 [Gammaproteobacteria bacterium]|nr:MAG: hypothetical protein DRR42_03540 [Gammaproteobacteria bacterium]